MESYEVKDGVVMIPPGATEIGWQQFSNQGQYVLGWSVYKLQHCVRNAYTIELAPSANPNGNK